MFALFHSPSKKIAQRGCTSVALNLAALKNETALANVRGVVAEFPDFAAGTPDAMKLPVSRHRQTRLMALIVFMFVVPEDGASRAGDLFSSPPCLLAHSAIAVALPL